MNKKNILVISIVAVVLVAGSWFMFKGGFTKDNSVQKKQSEKTLEVGMSMPYGFMEFINKEGNPDGYDVDVIKEVAKRMGMKVSIHNYEWDDLFAAVKESKVDVGISAIAMNPERQKTLLFSDPYFNAGQSIIVRKDDDSIKTEKDLKNKKVGSQVETTCIEEARKHTTKGLLKEYKDTGDTEEKGTMVYDLRKGNIDAIVIGYEAAVGIVKARPNELKLAGNPFTNDFSGIISQKDNKEMIVEINKVLRSMKRDGTLGKILKKWFE